MTGIAITKDRVYTYIRYNGRFELPDTTHDTGLQNDNFILLHDVDDGRLIWHKRIGVEEVNENPPKF